MTHSTHLTTRVQAAAIRSLALCLCLLFSTEIQAGDKPSNGAKSPENATPQVSLTDRVWPENPGDADVCIWKDDKLAAVTLTIDDNIAYQIDWWTEIGEKYGYPFTWFVITNWVENRQPIGGTWEQYRELVEKGHDVQSHSASHLNDKDLTIDDEYRLSKEAIEENIPGHRARTIAYPGGSQSGRNDPEVASKYYIAARSTPSLINGVNNTDYMKINSASGVIVYNDPKSWAWLGHMTEQTSRKNLYRGWYCAHFHEAKEKSKEHIENALTFLKEHDADFWVGRFTDVALYARERKTAEVKTLSSNAQEIRLSLTDQMPDADYDLPLTVKVRLPSDWKNVSALQGQKETASRIVIHDGAPYALVQAVPDRGEVVLRR